MVGEIWYLYTILCSFLWLCGSSLAPHLSLGELAAASVVVASVCGTWLVYGVGMLMQSIQWDTVLGSTALFAVLVLARKDTWEPHLRSRLFGHAPVGKPLCRVSAWDDTCAALLTCALGLPICYLYNIRMIPTDDYGNIVTGASCYGDLPIHMQIANSFLVGVNQRIKWGYNMMSPIFAGAPMTYPFLPDFHAAVLVSAGSSMRWGFMLPGASLALALIALLFYLSLRVTRSRLGAVLAVLLTIGAGGMGGPRWYAKQGWGSMLSHDVVQHDPDGEWMMLWFAFIPHILLPQRGANFAYPMAILILLIMWIATDGNSRLPAIDRSALLLYAAAFSASLPMMQAHAFIGIGLIIAILFLLDAHKWMRDSRLMAGWALAGITAMVLGYPQMAQFQKTVSEGFGGKFMQYGWLYHNYEFGKPYGVLGFFRFWWHSLGPAWALYCIATLLALLECVKAAQRVRRLVKDDGSGAVATQLAAVASELGYDTDAKPAASQRGHESHGAASPYLEACINALDAVLSRILAVIPSRVREAADAVAAPLNAFSVTGRALDSIKLNIGALAVFLLGNYVNMQPWDRDNAKIFYVWVFVASISSGALIAAPFEWLAVAQPGRARFDAWTIFTSRADARSGGLKFKAVRATPASPLQVGSRSWQQP